jgi:hypothetical protein
MARQAVPSNQKLVHPFAREPIAQPRDGSEQLA